MKGRSGVVSVLIKRHVQFTCLSNVLFFSVLERDRSMSITLLDRASFDTTNDVNEA